MGKLSPSFTMPVMTRWFFFQALLLSLPVLLEANDPPNAVPGGKQPNVKELTRERDGLRKELVRIAEEKRAAQHAAKKK